MASRRDGAIRGEGGPATLPERGQELQRQYEQFEATHREMGEVYALIYRRFVHPAGPPFYEEGVEAGLPPSVIPEHRAVAKVLFNYLEALRTEARVLASAKAICEQNEYADNPATRAATREVLGAMLSATKRRTAFGRVLDGDWLAVWGQATTAALAAPVQAAGGDTGWLNEVVDDLLEENSPGSTASQLWDSTESWTGRLFGCGEVTRNGEVLLCVGARSFYRPVKYRVFRQRVAARKRAQGAGHRDARPAAP